MKKFVTCALTAVFALGAMTGCGALGLGNGGGGGESDLRIMVYFAGYGRDWLDDAIRVYNEYYPDVHVTAEGDALAFETVKTKLENNNCDYDVIIIDSGYYESYVAGGYLEPLDDMYDSLVPGTDKKASEIINSQIREARTVKGSVYGVPWQQNNASGLIYNVEMFKKYGWDQDLPETMDEFWQLCDKIDADTEGRVAPITFGGADGYGYTIFNCAQWLYEYYGVEGMKTFFKLDSPKVFTDQQEGRTKVYETLARFTKGNTSSGRPIALKGSEGATAITAQTNFVNGKAAMTVCGQWFPTEMQPYTDLTQFESGYLPMPHINADKKTGDGKEDTSGLRFSTDGNLLGIPASSQHKEEAKNFLLSMLTSKSYTTFVRDNCGLTRPIEGVAVDTSQFDGFAKSAYEYFGGEGVTTLYQISSDALIEKGTLALFQAYRGAFFSEITGKATYEEALAVAKNCYTSEIGYLMQRWDADNKKWN